MTPMKVLAGVIYISALALITLAVLAYYHAPAYENGVRTAIEVFKDVLLVAVGVKGGAMLPGPETPPKPVDPPKE